MDTDHFESEQDSDLEVSDLNSDSDSEIMLPFMLAQPHSVGIIGMYPNSLTPVPRAVLEDITIYGRGLTPLHLYLGELCKIDCTTIFEENSILTMPVLFLKLHLMPGQILPFIAYSSGIQHLFDYVLNVKNNYRFGVAYKFNTDGQDTFGTTAVVFEYNLSHDHSFTYSIKAMGHQRFKILSANPFPNCEYNNSMKLATVKILPNTELSTHPYNKKYLNRRHREAYSTQVIQPKWVYQQFDENHLTSLLTNKIKMLFQGIEVSSDPRILSFQVMRLGVFSSKQITLLLGIDSTILRLQRQLNYWDENQPTDKFMCATKNCRLIFSSTSNVFSMSTDGPQGIYCNRWGDIHSLITITSLDTILELTKVEFSSYTCSWFFGFSGLKVLCPLCLRHFGWRFISSINSNITFYALNMKDVVTR